MAPLPVPANNEEYSLETRGASPAHFLTRIKSFSLLSKNGISKIESMEFQAGDCKWKLIIYPNGDDKAKEADHISVYLSLARTASLPASREINAIVNFFLYNHISDNYLCFRGKARRFHALNPKWGINKFMDKKRFTDPSNGYLFDDNCLFGAEVFTIKNERVIENVSVLAVTNRCKRKWKIPDFSKREKVWNSEEFSAGGFKWRINLYPKGVWMVKGRYISLYLECVDSKSFVANKKVKATCLFIFRSMRHGLKDHSRKAIHWFKSSSSSWGYHEFLGIGEATTRGLIVNNSCHLKMQLSVEAIQEPL